MRPSSPLPAGEALAPQAARWETFAGTRTRRTRELVADAVPRSRPRSGGGPPPLRRAGASRTDQASGAGHLPGACLTRACGMPSAPNHREVTDWGGARGGFARWPLPCPHRAAAAKAGLTDGGAAERKPRRARMRGEPPTNTCREPEKGRERGREGGERRVGLRSGGPGRALGCFSSQGTAGS